MNKKNGREMAAEGIEKNHEKEPRIARMTRIK